MDSLSKQANSYERKRLSKERKFQKKLQRAIMKGLKPVEETLDYSTYDNTFVEETMTDLYADTSKSLFTYTYKMVNPKKKKDILGDIANIFAQRSARWLLTYGYDKIESVNDTIQDKVRRSLASSFEKALSIPDITKNLMKEMSTWSKFEATRVARTETTAAAGQGSLEGADLSGVTLRKVWIAAFDSRTRVTHRTADQKTRLSGGISLRSDFDIGGDKMQSPGTGSVAKENVNCRCSIGYVSP